MIKGTRLRCSFYGSIVCTSNLKGRLRHHWYTRSFAGSTFVHSKVEMVNAKKFSNVCSTSKGYPAVQAFSQELVQFFTALFRYYRLVWNALVIPLNLWSPTCRSHLNEFDKYIILGFEFSLCNLELPDFKIPNAWKVTFTTVPLGPYHVLATYYGALMHENLSFGASNCPSLYVEVTLVVSVTLLVGKVHRRSIGAPSILHSDGCDKFP